MKNFTQSVCPDDNTLAEFTEGKLLGQEHKEIFLHVANCSRCRDLCAFAAGELARLKSGKKRTVSQKTQKMISEKISGLLNSDLSRKLTSAWAAFSQKIIPMFDSLDNAEVIAAGRSRSSIVFSSIGSLSSKSWKMQLFFPTQPGDDLEIEVVTPDKKNINGKLVFCGNLLEIRAGCGAIGYDLLRKTHDNAEVAFIFEDGERVMGRPEL